MPGKKYDPTEPIRDISKEPMPEKKDIVPETDEAGRQAVDTVLKAQIEKAKKCGGNTSLCDMQKKRKSSPTQGHRWTKETAPRAGRKKGAVAVGKREMRNMIVLAFKKAGGEKWLAKYLKELADKRPDTFAIIFTKMIDTLFSTPRHGASVTVDQSQRASLVGLDPQTVCEYIATRRAELAEEREVKKVQAKTVEAIRTEGPRQDWVKTEEPENEVGQG